MRIVTARAAKLSLALQEAKRFAQPVGGSGDFKLLVMPAPGCVIELQLVLAERLSRAVRKCVVPLTPKSIRQLEAGRLKVALHADFHLALTRQFRRIHDR